MTISNSTISNDQEKFLAAQLLMNAQQKLIAQSICDKVTQPKGAGLTAYFVRYTRMNVPVTTLTEGTDPTASDFSLAQVTVTLDQWGDTITLTDIAQLTAKHPLMQQAMKLLADNAQRVIDREVQIVWLAGTNVQYGDASVTARANITSTMKVSDTVLHKARINLVNGGAPMRDGPTKEQVIGQATSASSIQGNNKYVAVCGPEVYADIMGTSTSLGTFVSVAMYANQKALYNAEVGEWLGIRWVMTNFIPAFTLFGNTTAAVASGATFGTGTPTVTISASGGSLATGTYYFKVTRKDLLRGFEEAISIPHTAAAVTGPSASIAFAFPATAGYVYNLYFDKTSGGGTSADSNLGLVQQNIAAGTTVTVTAASASTTTAPANIKVDGTVAAVYSVYIFGATACAWVGFQNLEVMVTPDTATTDNPLKLRRKVSYKFMGKTVITNQNFMLRLELAASY